MKKAEQLEANRGLMSHDMSQGALKKKRENTIENEKATVLSAGLEVWRLVLMGVAEIVTRAASTSHDNPVAEFGCECNLQLLR